MTYDPRGIGDSSRDDTGDVTPEQQAGAIRVRARHGRAVGRPHGQAGSGEPRQAGETACPGLLIVPRGHHQVMAATVSRPARTAGSASASSVALAREPVR